MQIGDSEQEKLTGIEKRELISHQLNLLFNKIRVKLVGKTQEQQLGRGGSSAWACTIPWMLSIF